MSMAAATRQEGLDKFYTVPSVAKECLDKIEERFPWNTWDSIVEPSAGNGSFFLQIPSPNKIGLDIAPEHPQIQQQDFFSYHQNPGQRCLVVGNPPFGKISSLAMRFFNHAASFASVIAFIVPRTFRRVSMQNKLDASFHLLFDMDIPLHPCAFSPPMMAKCCFQIWERKPIRRIIIDLALSHPHWEFLPYGPIDAEGQPTPPTNADFAIRAYGGACGELRDTNLQGLRPKSWHWIRAILPKELLMQRFQALDYSLSENTARQNSIGRGELVRLYHNAYT